MRNHGIALVLLALFTLLSGIPADAGISRLPLCRETEIANGDKATAVILVPDSPQYRQLGVRLSATIQERTGVKVPVEVTKGYVTRRPMAVRQEKLGKNFILLGQFWNNAVLERLYNNYFDPTDAFFPGPGGYELRTVCSPFRNGHNCLVVTGSDLDGCQKAVSAFAENIEMKDGRAIVPFLLKVRLSGGECDRHGGGR